MMYWTELGRAEIIRTDDGFEMDLLLYVDDCIFASNDADRAEKVIDALEQCGGGHAIERLGEASWFLGMSVEQYIANGRLSLSPNLLSRRRSSAPTRSSAT